MRHWSASYFKKIRLLLFLTIQLFVCYRSLCYDYFLQRIQKLLLFQMVSYTYRKIKYFTLRTQSWSFCEMHLNSSKYNKCKLLLVVQNAMRKSNDLTLNEAVLSKTFFCAEQHKSNRITRIFAVAYTLQFWSECKHMNSPPWQFYLGYSQTEIFLGNFQM
mgnify:CR=1 FL=1